LRALAKGNKSTQVSPETSEALDTYNLLQIGCSVNLNDMDYLLAQRLIYLKSEIDKEQDRQMKIQNARRR